MLQTYHGYATLDRILSTECLHVQPGLSTCSLRNNMLLPTHIECKRVSHCPSLVGPSAESGTFQPKRMLSSNDYEDLVEGPLDVHYEISGAVRRRTMRVLIIFIEWHLLHDLAVLTAEYCSVGNEIIRFADECDFCLRVTRGIAINFDTVLQEFCVFAIRPHEENTFVSPAYEPNSGRIKLSLIKSQTDIMYLSRKKGKFHQQHAYMYDHVQTFDAPDQLSGLLRFSETPTLEYRFYNIGWRYPIRWMASRDIMTNDELTVNWVKCEEH